MKQILQNLGNGETLLAEVPCPARGRGSVLIETSKSLVSIGTERMLIEFGKGSWLAKARSQPDKVKQVIQKIRTDGLWTTLEAVRAKLDTPIPLGYCNVGRVVESDDSSGYSVGDRVISNGHHAEVVSVPENLTAKIPANVDDETAAYTVVGAIGLQGIRLLNPTLGERFVVSGLGLIGLLSVQILRAHGCQVLGIDFDPKKLELARQFGAATVDLSVDQDPVKVASDWSHGNGVDGVLITAATRSDQLIHQSATMCRKRGRIVLVGVIGLNLQRADFYEKELTFQVSCSYGPGRYEPNYEQKGMDYPIGFVRWTEQRNFEAVLALMAENKIQTKSLTTHRVSFSKALQGYEAAGDSAALGIVLEYPLSQQDDQSKFNRQVIVRHSSGDAGKKNTGLGFIGAGSFTTRMLLPLLPGSGLTKKAIVSSTGVTASHAARKFGFETSSSNISDVLDREDIDAVFVTTRHNSHASIVCRALESGKHVFVEKPLAMSDSELEMVRDRMEEYPDKCLMVGFNRRFSPHTVALMNWLESTPGPRAIVMTVNAGEIPKEHWTQDPEIGGGRVLGEACHFIDLSRMLARSPMVEIQAMALDRGEGSLGDCVSLTMKFQNGSIATVHYLANGSKSFPKERVEVFAGGNVFCCENFRVSKMIGGNKKFKTSKQDKGHRHAIEAFINAIKNGTDWPIPGEELLEVSHYTLEAARSVRRQLA